MTRQTYSDFAMSVKLYLEQRRTGIKDLQTYMDGVNLYLEDTDVTDLYLNGLEEASLMKRHVILGPASMKKSW